MLKADFHVHCDTDEHHSLEYTAKDIIRTCAKLNYKVLSITNHDRIRHTNELARFAKKKGVILISGIEKTIEGKEVLLINIKKESIGKIKNFNHLEKYKRENVLVIAPHPFYPHPKSLHSKLMENIRLFDGIEYSHFYLKYLNFNRRAVKIAKKFDLPLIGTSDAHHLWQLNYTYSLVDSDAKIDSIIDAIKGKKVKLETTPFPLIKFIRMAFWLFF